MKENKNQLSSELCSDFEDNDDLLFKAKTEEQKRNEMNPRNM